MTTGAFAGNSEKEKEKTSEKKKPWFIVVQPH